MVIKNTLFLLILCCTQVLWADAPVPEEFKGVGIDQSVLGSEIDLKTEFTDEEGNKGPLSSFMLEGKPAIVSVVYYNCPGLCNLHMNGAGRVFQELKLQAGKDFNWILLTMDSSEGPELAHRKKLNYMGKFDIAGAEKGWKFLTGTKEATDKIMKQLGFSYKWDEKTKQFAHSAAFYMINTVGEISQIIPGVGFDEQTIRLALVQTAQGSIGSVVDQLLLFCFRFDPSKNKFTLYAFNIMRAAAALTVIILGVILIPLWRKEKNRTGGENS